MRVAFFGGSFDPPHLGHIAIARAAQRTLALDTVLFAPVGLQPLKPDGPSASFTDRLAMTRLAIENQPHFELSLADAPDARGETPGQTPNYTIDTLQSLRNSFPPATELYLLIGADSFRTLARWHRAAEIPFAANLVIASRPGENITNPATHLPPGLSLTPSPSPNHFRIANPTGQSADLYLLPNLHYEISATQLRHQINNPGKETTPLLNPAVLNYIHHHHLYK
jgi:nicotinate-nucleotide adenylyltransferase